jgi:hypothetical protein
MPKPLGVARFRHFFLRAKDAIRSDWLTFPMASWKPLWGLPSGYVKIAIEAMAIEIVDLPINSMVIFQFVM